MIHRSYIFEQTNLSGQFTDSFTLFLTDLREKANDLNDLGQGGAISTALEDIKPIYQVSIVRLTHVHRC